MFLHWFCYLFLYLCSCTRCIAIVFLHSFKIINERLLVLVIVIVLVHSPEPRRVAEQLTLREREEMDQMLSR